MISSTLIELIEKAYSDAYGDTFEVRHDNGSVSVIDIPVFIENNQGVRLPIRHVGFELMADGRKIVVISSRTIEQARTKLPSDVKYRQAVGFRAHTVNSYPADPFMQSKIEAGDKLNSNVISLSSVKKK